jgi:glycosyltransferase involved in cell wall biosynthesis
MMKLPLSLVVITKNEEENIERCLRSVPFAGDVVVVDSFSSDRTVERAKALGARVFQESWRGFGPQKQFGVSQAKHDWILSLDADEALSPELAKELHARFANLDAQTGYRLPRRSFHLGRWILHGGWTPDRQLRLFNRSSSKWNEDGIHESVKSPKVESFRSPILHWVFRDLSHQVVTNDRYSGLQAEALDSQTQKFSIFRLVTKPWVKFMETYFWKRGFLDGLPGFIISVSAAYSVFLKHAKLWERQQKRNLR